MIRLFFYKNCLKVWTSAVCHGPFLSQAFIYHMKTSFFVKNCRFKILKLLMCPEKLNIPTGLKIHLVLGPKNAPQNRLFMKLNSFWF